MRLFIVALMLCGCSKPAEEKKLAPPPSAWLVMEGSTTTAVSAPFPEDPPPGWSIACDNSGKYFSPCLGNQVFELAISTNREETVKLCWELWEHAKKPKAINFHETNQWHVCP